MVNRAKQFDQQVSWAREVFLSKNEEYGDSIRFGGVLSACYNIVGAAMRLMRLVFHTEDHGQRKKEIVRGIIVDILNYAAIGLIFIDEDNWLGTED